MPLMHGKGQKAFEHNIKAEMHADKPLKQSLAIAYAMKRRSQKRHDHEDEYAKGGDVGGGKHFKNPHPEGIAEFEEEENRSGYSHGDLPCPDCESGHCNIHGADMLEHGGDVVDRIMRKGVTKMSEGGRVANQDHGENDNDLADFSRNEFDDLVLRDDLEQHYTGENSGDYLDDEREDDDRHDIVARVMRSQAKKDRNPPGYGVSYGRYK